MLTVITPCRDQSEEAAIRAHVQSVIPGVPHRCAIGPEIFRNRNSCIAAASESDILCWDSDIRATPREVAQVTLSGRGIIGGAYRHRKFDRYCAGVWAQEQLPDADMLVSRDTTGIVQVPWIGAGFLFIPLTALSRLEMPYFRHEFIPGDQTSEDVGFCIHAQRHGLSVYLDADCIVQHLI